MLLITLHAFWSQSKIHFQYNISLCNWKIIPYLKLVRYNLHNENLYLNNLDFRFVFTKISKNLEIALYLAKTALKIVSERLYQVNDRVEGFLRNKERERETTRVVTMARERMTRYSYWSTNHGLGPLTLSLSIICTQTRLSKYNSVKHGTNLEIINWLKTYKS